jgi:flagellar hook-basal body complex protein FliE
MEMTREEYRKKVEAQIAVWEARLDALKAKADQAGTEARTELRKQIEELRALQAPAKNYLEQLRAASARAWSDVRAEVEEAWMKLSVAIETAWKRVAPAK